MSEYKDFAIDVAKSVAHEEGDKLRVSIEKDLTDLMEAWGKLLGERIQERMDSLGIPQNLAISVEWNPGHPVFHLVGKTYVGENTEDDD